MNLIKLKDTDDRDIVVNPHKICVAVAVRLGMGNTVILRLDGGHSVTVKGCLDGIIKQCERGVK